MDTNSFTGTPPDNASIVKMIEAIRRYRSGLMTYEDLIEKGKQLFTVPESITRVYVLHKYLASPQGAVVGAVVQDQPTRRDVVIYVGDDIENRSRFVAVAA